MEGRSNSKLLRTNEEIYALIGRVARAIAWRYQTRMNKLGLTTDDLIQRTFTTYLESGGKPTRRIMKRDGKKTKPAVPLTLPIDEGRARRILQRDIWGILETRPSDEYHRVTLIPYREDDDPQSRNPLLTSWDNGQQEKPDKELGHDDSPGIEDGFSLGERRARREPHHRQRRIREHKPRTYVLPELPEEICHHVRWASDMSPSLAPELGAGYEHRVNGQWVPITQEEVSTLGNVQWDSSEASRRYDAVSLVGIEGLPLAWNAEGRATGYEHDLLDNTSWPRPHDMMPKPAPHSLDEARTLVMSRRFHISGDGAPLPEDLSGTVPVPTKLWVLNANGRTGIGVYGRGSSEFNDTIEEQMVGGKPTHFKTKSALGVVTPVQPGPPARIPDKVDIYGNVTKYKPVAVGGYLGTPGREVSSDGAREQFKDFSEGFEHWYQS